MRIPAEQIELIDDINHDDICYSDGCGLMSAAIADKIAKYYGFLHVSACQIRIGGCKGVLMLSPDLPGESIKIRKSMKKVDDFGGDLALNVIRCSTYSLGHLNRQFVIHLSVLGAKESFFFDKLSKSMRDLSLNGKTIIKLEEEEQK